MNCALGRSENCFPPPLFWSDVTIGRVGSSRTMLQATGVMKLNTMFAGVDRWSQPGASRLTVLYLLLVLSITLYKFDGIFVCVFKKVNKSFFFSVALWTIF